MSFGAHNCLLMVTQEFRPERIKHLTCYSAGKLDSCSMFDAKARFMVNDVYVSIMLTKNFAPPGYVRSMIKTCRVNRLLNSILREVTF
jgi:hypothetical protein